MRPFVLLLLAGCPNGGNPHQLWIAQNGSEAMLKLADEEPDPF